MINNNSQSQKLFFDQHAKKQDPVKLMKEFKNPSKVNLIQRNFVSEVLNPKKGEKILELGAGTGLWSILFLSLGCDVTAVDISGENLNLLQKIYNILKTEQKKYNWGKLIIETKDYKDVSFRSEFDKAFSSNFLHHISDRYLAVKKMADAVEINGTVVSLEPNPKTPFYYLYFKLIRDYWEFEKGLNDMTEKNIKSYFESNNLEIIEIKKFGIIPCRMLKIFPVFIQKANYQYAKFVPFYMFHIFKGIKQ